MSIRRAVAAPCFADDPADQLGPDVPIGYSIDQGKVVSVLDGIKAAVPGATVNYAQGCDTSCTSATGMLVSLAPYRHSNGHFSLSAMSIGASG